MARSLRFLVTSASVLAVMSCAGAGYAQTTQKDIIWNDPASPAASAAAPVAPTNTAPIRDDYTNPPQPPQNLVPPPPQSSNQGIIWNEPSASPNANAGNANTSVHTIAPRPPVSASAAPLPPGAAGPCREYTQDVVIDGRHTTAHGHACRQPDGSWRIID